MNLQRSPLHPLSPSWHQYTAYKWAASAELDTRALAEVLDAAERPACIAPVSTSVRTIPLSSPRVLENSGHGQWLAAREPLTVLAPWRAQPR
jgi:hypothetical protein